MNIDRRVATEYISCLWPKLVTEEMQLLEGLISGISIDGTITSEEIPALEGWCRRHDHVRKMRPFSEIIAGIEEALADGVIDEEDRVDLLWLCQRFSRPNLFFNSITSDIQRLRGLLAGIAADGSIEEREIEILRTWLNQHDHLQGYWPFDEINSLLVSALRNGVVDAREHRLLLEFCSDFLASTADLVCGRRPRERLLLRVVCAVQPQIVFPYRLFCLTGTPQRCSQAEMATVISELGGRTTPQVSRQVSYLVVGASGGACWALSCYGRKVEEATALRRQGVPLQIVHELDFWDAAHAAR